MKYAFLLLYNFLENFFHLVRIKKFLQTKVFFKKPIIFDIGAHKGKITRLFFDLYRNAKVYSFEPNKSLIEIIKQNNQKKNLVLCNYALGEKKKEAIIDINDLDLTSSLSKTNKSSFYLKIKNLILGKKINSYKQKVKVITLDHFCENKKIKKIDLIKVDIEGYEYMFLQGARKMIRNVHYIIIEVQKNSMYENYSDKKIEKFLKKNNFRLLKKFNFPLMFFQDRIYKNKKFIQ
jgi:FkbM family methyltransferase